MKKVVLGYDHKAVDLGKTTGEVLKSLGFESINVGAQNEETRLPLQKLVPNFVKAFRENDALFGILSCGTGVGVEIGGNRFKGIRASLCHTPDQAKLARQYDDANVLCLASCDELDLEEMLRTWIETDYDGSPNRQEMLDIFDTWGSS